MAQQSIEELIKEETSRRLAIMEKDDYVFPEKINGADVAVIVGCIAVSLVLIILCMVGVIQ